jgi:minor extracellular serine protease Vpr
MRALFIAGISLIMSVTACSRAHQTQTPYSPYGDATKTDRIFSNRPQTATDTVLLIKLKSQPLIASLKTDKAGKKSVDPDQVATIAAEQQHLLNQLAQISPAIVLIYRYRLVINGVAIVAPISTLEQIRKISDIAYVEVQGNFSHGDLPATQPSIIQDPAQAMKERNSVKFIGGEEAHAAGFRGQGLRLGIIDTGIDYTHAMLGGAGTADAYKAIDPAKDSSAFPNAKVVGGIDLVGTDYDSASANYAKRIPHIDANPIDEAGHGTHVAGTVAGRGDGVNTYDGVAPDATLYAIKVFGAKGSTGDAVVIAGLEYAANPKADLDLADKLDAVNLSLGSDFGSPHVLYTEAVQNLSRGGTLVLAAAGNSGDSSYIVSSPGVSDEAF